MAAIYADAIEYVHLPVLARTAEILDAYKKQKNGDWPLYERQFLGLMQARHFEEKAIPRDAGRRVFAVQRGKAHNCQRLVAEYLKGQMAQHRNRAYALKGLRKHG